MDGVNAMREQIVILWFKRDLRVVDHAPLAAAAACGLPVLPLYIVEPDYWRQPFASSRHWHFIHDSLADLHGMCARLGQPMAVHTGDAVAVFKKLHSAFDVTAIYAHEEIGNDWTYKRDTQVLAWCAETGIALHEFPTNGVVRRLKTRDNWAGIRNRRMAQPCVATPAALTPLGARNTGFELGALPDKADALFGAPPPSAVQRGGRAEGEKLLQSFLTTRGRHYTAHMSAPGLSEIYGSRLSAHLTWGTLSAREVDQATAKCQAQLSGEAARAWKRPLAAFRSRLAWRCHFMQKLEDQPSIEHKAMHAFFDGMREDSFDPELFAAWQAGRTGYPLVDACMRNLTANGWITFRMRAMLVSFASYDLWLDWRQTGYVLARLFTDYEPGIHYSQLQMQSGVTGINAIRIYNPVKQSYDHDPDGAFIKKWVPELTDAPSAFVHEPWKMSRAMQQESGCIIGQDYPEPVVDHRAAVRAAREKMARIRKMQGFSDASKMVHAKLGSRKRTRRKARSGARAPAAQLDMLNLLDG